MILILVLCPRCHTGQVMKGGKTTAHLQHDPSTPVVDVIPEYIPRVPRHFSRSLGCLPRLLCGYDSLM